MNAFVRRLQAWLGALPLAAAILVSALLTAACDNSPWPAGWYRLIFGRT